MSELVTRAPLGELLVDEDEQKVCCHVCGRWFAKLGPHIRAAHDLSPDDYRLEFGLRAQRPLQAPVLSERAAAQARRRNRTDPRVRDGLARGVGMARSGQLPALGTAANAARPRAGERDRVLQTTGSAQGTARAGRYATARRRRAVELGFPTLTDYLHQRYEVDRASVRVMARELGCAVSSVEREMDVAGIQRRSDAEGLAAGRAHLAAVREARRRQLFEPASSRWAPTCATGVLAARGARPTSPTSSPSRSVVRGRCWSSTTCN